MRVPGGWFYKDVYLEPAEAATVGGLRAVCLPDQVQTSDRLNIP
jgi:hypothetical protein